MYVQPASGQQYSSIACSCGGSELLPAGCMPHHAQPLCDDRAAARRVVSAAISSSSMRSSSSSRLLLAAAATSGACCLALVLAVGVCTASGGGGGLAAQGRRQLRPPSTPVLGVDSLAVAVTAPAPPQEKGFSAADGAARDLLGASAAGQDYGFVDPPPDTRRRGGTAPIPHS